MKTDLFQSCGHCWVWNWCWSWNSNTWATSCKELTHWKRPWCWEGLGAGREGEDRGWDGWMVSPTRWTWVWVNSGSWWYTGRPGMLGFMGLQRVEHDWTIELNWDDWSNYIPVSSPTAKFSGLVKLRHCWKHVHILKMYMLNSSPTPVDFSPSPEYAHVKQMKFLYTEEL